MDKNKSIDGLVERSKKAPKKTSPKSKTVAKKTTTASKAPAPKTPKNPTKKETTEDFLKPVQAFNFDEQSGNLVTASPTEKTKKSKTPPKKANKKSRKIVRVIIIIILLILIGAGIAFILWGNDIIAKITGGQGNVFDLLTFIDEKYEPLKTDSNGRTNILAIGTSGYNMEGDEGNGTHAGAQLTDSIMVISLDQETGDLAMLSLPRDLKASPTCTATGKINEVYWCNNMSGDDDAAGATALMNEVGNILGLEFQYYTHLNWGSLVQIVDTLGGITINLDEDISDRYYTGAVFKAGVDYTINGEQALGLARARHGTLSGDFSRGASQQKILIGIKNKVFEKNLSISDLLSLASTLGDNLRTNFSVEELKTLAHLTADFDFDAMRQISLISPERLMTTGTINGISYVLPAAGVGNYTSIRNYIIKMFSSDPKVYEDATLLVLNATETYGIAAALQTELKNDGYTHVDIDNYSTLESDDKYLVYALTEDKPGTQKLLEKRFDTTTKSASELPSGINTRYDFVIIINKAEA